MRDEKKEIRHICLTGFMGSGKSTIGKILAGRLQVPFVDTDDQIEQKEGMSVKEIFMQKGEDFFRRRESEEIARELRATEKKVISLGGGALMQSSNRDLVRKKALLIYIYSRPENIYHRIRHSTRRPLFRGEDEHLTEEESLGRIKDLMKVRSEGYTGADIVYDRDELDANAVAVNLFEMIRRDFPGLVHTGKSQQIK